MENKDNLNENMLKVMESDLSDPLESYVEIAIDSFMEGAAKEIPIVKTLIGAWKTGVSVRDAFLIKKIIQFMYELKEIPQDQRQKFINDLESESKQKRVGEQIIIILDRMDELEKSTLMARAIKFYVQGHYDIETLLRLWKSIEKIDLLDITYLKEKYAGTTNENAVKYRNIIDQNLAIAGLLNIDVGDMSLDGKTGGFIKNQLGEHFYLLVRD